jgi:aryl-alcohol dehydrogenase-like predicted oxidoreductase
LTGKIDESTQFTGDDLRRSDPKFQPPRFQQYLQAVKRLEHFAQDKFAKSMLAFAIRWVLDQQGVSVALWGARHPGELSPVKDVMGWKLSAEDLAYVDQIIAESVHDPVGPEFMAPPERRPEEPAQPPR